MGVWVGGGCDASALPFLLSLSSMASSHTHPPTLFLSLYIHRCWASTACTSTSSTPSPSTFSTSRGRGRRPPSPPVAPRRVRSSSGPWTAPCSSSPGKWFGGSVGGWACLSMSVLLTHPPTYLRTGTTAPRRRRTLPTTTATLSRTAGKYVGGWVGGWSPQSNNRLLSNPSTHPPTHLLPYIQLWAHRRGLRRRVRGLRRPGREGSGLPEEAGRRAHERPGLHQGPRRYVQSLPPPPPTHLPCSSTTQPLSLCLRPTHPPTHPLIPLSSYPPTHPLPSKGYWCSPTT